tara:strand:+ start:749 stop:1093 length:345 start_codon:yes stop_codon:yes gene_type:complete
MIIGIRKVYIPKRKLFELFLLKSAISISRPAKNIIYRSPAVPERMIPLSLNNKLNPFGPMIAPAIIKPRICGILNFPKRIGAARIIIRITRNFRTGLVSGSEVSIMLRNIIRIS